MRVRIKRLDKSLPLPVYQTSGSVGFDIHAREDTVVPAGGIGLVPGNIVVETPPGYMLMVSLRSSTPRKKGLHKPHGVGVIDNDYCGDEDEIKVQVYNGSGRDVRVEKGERIAQGIFVRVEKSEWVEVDSLGKSRGGFGSTG